MESLTSRIVSGCSWGVLGVVLGIGVNSQITATSVMRPLVDHAFYRMSKPLKNGNPPQLSIIYFEQQQEQK